MKKILLILALGAAFSSQAQVNGDFEQWTDKGTYEDPDGWFTFNVFSTFGDSISCLKSTTAYSGKYSALIRSGYSNFLMDTIPGLLVQSIPFITKPNSLRFAYQHSAPSGDSGAISVEFYKGATDNDGNIIGYSYVSLGPNTNWQRVEEPITWTDLNTPDTVVITIMTAFSGTSQMKIDDLSLSIYGADIKQVTRPAQSVWFTTAGDLFAPGIPGTAALELFEPGGKLVYSGTLANGRNSETASLPSGIYFYRIHTPELGNIPAGKILKH